MTKYFWDLLKKKFFGIGYETFWGRKSFLGFVDENVLRLENLF